MTDWVFCNKCSQKYQANLKLHLSECGHIFCEKCILSFKKGYCNLCNKSVKMLEIGKNMDSDTQQYFWPIEGLLQKFVQVFQFQNKHKGMFQQAFIKKYNYAKKECIHYYNSHKKLKQENELLRSMLKSAGINPGQFLVSSTPLSERNNKTFDHNMSMLSSVKLTPGPYGLIGSAQRVNNYQPMSTKQHQVEQLIRGHSMESSEGPSPLQTVPKGYHLYQQSANLAPIHQQQTPGVGGYLFQDPSAYIEMIRKGSNLMARGNPRN